MTVSSPPVVSIPFEIWRIARRQRALLDVEFAGMDCTPGEVGLYSVLLVGPMTPSDIARHSGLVPTTVSKMLQRVEDRGHLLRKANPDDGRSMLVSLNAEGRRFHEKAMAGIRAVRDAIEHELDEDSEWVAMALVRLERALSDMTGGATTAEDRRRWPRKLNWDQRLTYQGDPLSREEEQVVREYIDWVRWRRDEQTKGAR